MMLAQEMCCLITLPIIINYWVMCGKWWALCCFSKIIKSNYQSKWLLIGYYCWRFYEWPNSIWNYFPFAYSSGKLKMFCLIQWFLALIFAPIGMKSIGFHCKMHEKIIWIKLDGNLWRGPSHLLHLAVDKI